MAGDIYIIDLVTSAFCSLMLLCFSHFTNFKFFGMLAGGAPLFQQASPSKLGMAGTAWSAAVLPHLAMRILGFG